MTCNGDCARCCCCGSKQLREMPGYNEDINNPGRPVKATIRWNFDSGLFNGEYFDLVRVNYTDPSNSGSYASTERVCMVEYRPGSGYPGGGYGGGDSPVCVGPTKSTPWVRAAYGKCCNNPAAGPNRAYAVFYRLSATLCDIALNVARCKKTTYACDYVNSIDADDRCGYLVNARMQLRLIVEVAEYRRGGLFDPIDCEDIVYPTAEDVPASFPATYWTNFNASDVYVPVARSRVVSSLRTIPTEIELFLPYGINQKECCSEWGVPENAFGIPKPSGWNDVYFQCLANDGNLNVKIVPDGCGFTEPCVVALECFATDYEQTINLGDWRFIGTGEPA